MKLVELVVPGLLNPGVGVQARIRQDIGMCSQGSRNLPSEAPDTPGPLWEGPWVVWVWQGADSSSVWAPGALRLLFSMPGPALGYGQRGRSDTHSYLP